MWSLVLGLCTLLTLTSQEMPVLTIQISNIRNDHGKILLSVYANPTEYPYKPFRTIPVGKDSLKKGKIIAVVNDLKPGTYAMCLLDDENNSGTMEYNFIGIPLEGYGFANNVRPLLKHPEFDRCLFTLGDQNLQMELIVRYKN